MGCQPAALGVRGPCLAHSPRATAPSPSPVGLIGLGTTESKATPCFWKPDERSLLGQWDPAPFCQVGRTQRAL